MSRDRAHTPRLSISRLLAAILASLLAMPAGAETAAVSEHAVKAVLFYKLPQFVYLPDGTSRAANLCSLGRHPIVDALERLARTPTQARAPSYQTVDNTAGTSHCDFLFIARDEADNLDTIINRLKNREIVTVSDIPGFAKAGGMVEFAQNAEKNGVQIFINRKAAQNQGIEFSAQLLRLARVVEP